MRPVTALCMCVALFARETCVKALRNRTRMQQTHTHKAVTGYVEAKTLLSHWKQSDYRMLVSTSLYPYINNAHNPEVVSKVSTESQHNTFMRTHCTLGSIASLNGVMKKLIHFSCHITALYAYILDTHWKCHSVIYKYMTTHNLVECDQGSNEMVQSNYFWFTVLCNITNISFSHTY